MIKINLICMGSLKEKYLKDAVDEYQKRISRFAQLKIIELKENIASSNSDADIIKALNKDAEEIKKHLKGYVICLDVQSPMMTSEEFSNKLEKISLNNSEISFIIGASNGIDKSIKQLSNVKISFSPMTFPHQLMRVIFLEQLYRAFTISNNIAYHK